MLPGMQTSNQYLCYCPTGYEWNAARTECIKVNAQQDEPVVNPQQKSRVNAIFNTKVVQTKQSNIPLM